MNQPKNKKPAPLAGGGSDRTEPGQGGVIATPQCPTVPPDSQPDFLRAALWYAKKGWHVFPCRPGGKEPLEKGGCKTATTDGATIRNWWYRWPDANIGIHPAPSGLVVLDVDAKKDGKGLESWKALLERFGAALEETVMANTPSGGLHVYYQKPGAYIRNATEDKSPLGQDIGVRFNGLYVVAPPSRTPTGSYSWVPGKNPHDRKPAPLPEGLAALLAEGKRGAGPATNHSALVTISSPIHDGARNNTLFRLGCSLRGKGKTQEEIEAALLEANAKWCVPPLPEDEVRKAAASAAEYPPGNPQTTRTVEVLSEDESDRGNANTLEALGFAKRFRWHANREAWMQWHGTRWLMEIERAVVSAASDTLYRHYAELRANADDKETERAMAWKMREVSSTSRVRAALFLLSGRPGIKTTSGEWDNRPDLLNFNNGTLDARTLALRPHDPNDMLTQLAPVVYDPEATCPSWLHHLETFLPDPEVRRQVQRDLGCSLFGTRLRQILPIWWGTGGNGKSTTLIVIRNILGDYAKMAAPELLVASKHDRHPSELADLFGARLVFASETAGGAYLHEDRLKALCSGENIKARFMGCDWFEFKPTWTIFLVTNHKPQLRDKDPAISRRVRLIPWTVALPEEKQRPQEEVLEELMDEASGIMSWMVDGRMDWQREKNWTASAVRAATGQYMEEQDILGPFLEDCCEVGPRFMTTTKELYAAYEEWCTSNGEEPMSKNSFSRRLFARGFTKERKGLSGARAWGGLRLKKTPGAPAAEEGATQTWEEPLIEPIIQDSAAGGGW